MKGLRRICTGLPVVTVLCAAAAALFTACTHKELCHDHSHPARVEVVFDWSKAPDADPATMSLYLFPSDGAEPIRHEFIDRNGGTITVPMGVYDVLCVNSDRETHRIRNREHRETFEVTTGLTRSLKGELASKSETAPLAAGAEEEPSVLEPETLWSDHAERIDINPDNGVTRIVLTPLSRVITCSVEIRNVENLRHAKALSAALTGMAGGWLAGTDALTEEKVTIPFGLDPANSGTQLTGRLSTFGHCPKSAGRHTLMVYALMADGNTYFMEEDVTDQLHDPEQDPTHIRIVIDKLPLPTPITGGGGLQPSVKEWQEIYIELPMN